MCYQLSQPFNRSYFQYFVPEPEDPIVLLGITDEFAFNESNIKNRGVVIDELEEINFEGQAVVKFGLSSQEFKFRQIFCKPIVDII